MIATRLSQKYEKNIYSNTAYGIIEMLPIPSAGAATFETNQKRKIQIQLITEGDNVK